MSKANGPLPVTLKGFTEYIEDRLIDVVAYNHAVLGETAKVRFIQLWNSYGSWSKMGETAQFDNFLEKYAEQPGSCIKKISEPQRYVVVRVSQVMDMARSRGGLPYADFRKALDDELMAIAETAKFQKTRDWAKTGNYSEIRALCPHKPGATHKDLNGCIKAIHTLADVLDAMQEDRPDEYRRSFSERMGLGSKGFETTYQSIVLRILEGSQDVPASKLLAKYHIIQAPQELRIRGSCTVCFGAEDKISLGMVETGISIPAVYAMTLTGTDATRIVTVENLTTFRDYDETNGEKTLVVYTEGYASTHVVQFLDKVCELTGIDRVHHFGDIDAYGYEIAKAMDAAMQNADVEPLLMDRPTYDAGVNAGYGLPLSADNRERFEKMLLDPWYSDEQKTFFKYIMETGQLLEQESWSV